jgi:hypothetical protein
MRRKWVETAAGTPRNLRIAEVVKIDVKIEDGKVTEYRTDCSCPLITKARQGLNAGDRTPSDYVARM